MTAEAEGAHWGTTRRTFLVAGGCVLLAALAGIGWRRSRSRPDIQVARPRRADNMAERASQDGVELWPTPLDQHGPVYRLNRSAAVVWAAVDGRRSAGDIAGELAATYGLQLAVAQRDTLACLRTLAAQGVVNGVPGVTPAASRARS
jgi:hypothetical protein